MSNGFNGNKTWARTIAAIFTVVAIVGAVVGGALWMQDEGHGCEMAIAAIEARLDVMDKRIGPGGWSHSDMHVYNALLKAVADHEVPDLTKID